MRRKRLNNLPEQAAERRRDRQSANRPEKPEAEGPPVFRSWRQMYLAVLGNLILLMIIFYVITRLFS